MNNNQKSIAFAVAVAVSIYIIAPSFSSKTMFSSTSKRPDKFTTGFINNRNDCFANSAIQALAGLPKLTEYLNNIFKLVDSIKEEQKRPQLTTIQSSLELSEVENEPSKRIEIPELLMHESLASTIARLQATVFSTTYITVWPVLHALEVIYKAKISTGQNDAQELSQLVLETLSTENQLLVTYIKQNELKFEVPVFPFKGEVADRLVCLKCKQSSKISTHPFTIYTLAVPQKWDCTLDEIISHAQMQTIEDYACLCCRIRTLVQFENNRGYRGNSDQENAIIKDIEQKLETAFINDDLSDELTAYMENYNKDGLELRKIKSTIAKKSVLVKVPEVLLVHLSRSMFDGQSATRNMCNVDFNQELVVTEQKFVENQDAGTQYIKYNLKTMIKHAGTHTQGHYECYRSKPEFCKDTISEEYVNLSPVIDRSLLPNEERDGTEDEDSRSSSRSSSRRPSRSGTLKKISGMISRRGSVASAAMSVSSSMESVPADEKERNGSVVSSSSEAASTKRLKPVKTVEKAPYWKISDSAVQEAKTSELLQEKKFVYMLYYELE